MRVRALRRAVRCHPSHWAGAEQALGCSPAGPLVIRVALPTLLASSIGLPEHRMRPGAFGSQLAVGRPGFLQFADRHAMKPTGLRFE